MDKLIPGTQNLASLHTYRSILPNFPYFPIPLYPYTLLIPYLRDMFKQTIQIRWADIDANRHLRHSVYYDYGASMRMNALSSLGLTMKKFEELLIGPVLFREEGIFKREILFEDEITINVELVKAREDFARWSLRHHFLKGDDSLAAIINIDGGWIDLTKRKLIIPTSLIRNVFEKLPKSSDFEWISPGKKV